MKKIIICNAVLKGGRGADSGIGVNPGNNKPQPFYDKTDKYKGMTYQEFENAIKDKTVEYIGLYDEEGKIIIAGTSYNKGSVAVPEGHPDFNKVTRLTHNHPADDKRVLGGSFSEADAFSLATYKFNGIRAVAREKTYLLQKSKSFKKSDTNKMIKMSVESTKKWDDGVAKLMKKVKNKKLTNANKKTIQLGYGTRVWKNLTKNSGYDYIEIKHK